MFGPMQRGGGEVERVREIKEHDGKGQNTVTTCEKQEASREKALLCIAQAPAAQTSYRGTGQRRAKCDAEHTNTGPRLLLDTYLHHATLFHHG